MNYSELLTNVRNYTEVSSDVLSDSVLDVFIQNTENRINREIDIDAFRKFQFSSFKIMDLNDESNQPIINDKYIICYL